MRRRAAGGRAGIILALLAAGAGACGGGAADKPVTFTPVSATTDGRLYTLTLGDLKMVVDSMKGARITELSLRGQNVLLTHDQNSTYGGTYWPSPQSSWCAAGGGCWPPPAAVDSGPYTGGIVEDNAILLQSGPQAIGDATIVVNKRFTPVPESGAVDVTYAAANASPDASISLAPWQLGRVAAGGLTFFGQGTGPVTYAADTDPTFTLDEMGGNLWYASAPVSHDSKALADGTGWLAQVTPDRLFCLVSYPDFEPAAAAPGEAEIEVYTDGEYVEVEQQGPFTTLAPGDISTWTARWKLRRVPAGTTIAAGGAALTSFAATTLAE